jgi:hypothetical protein
MSEPKTAMDIASIKQSCRRLHMPTVAGQCVRLNAPQKTRRRASLRPGPPATESSYE